MCLTYSRGMRAPERLLYRLMKRENDGWISSYIDEIHARATIPLHRVEAAPMTKTSADHDTKLAISFSSAHAVSSRHDILLLYMCSLFRMMM